MARIWPELPPELAERIATSLPRNVLACSVRRVNKAAAALFRGPQHTTVRLNERVPEHAFARQFGAADATRELSLAQRRQLLSHVATTGSIQNLEVALAAAGCELTAAVLEAAAAARQLHVCEWLLQRGCPAGGALAAAAQAGHRDVCEWLMDRGFAASLDAAVAAASRGPSRLVEWLLTRLPLGWELSADAWRLPAAAAKGCDLPLLQRLYDRVEGLQQAAAAAAVTAPHSPDARAAALMTAAVRSPTHDWAAKVEWLESRGYRPASIFDDRACSAAAGLPDAVQRLSWLRQRAYRCGCGATESAAAVGNAAALAYLIAAGVPISRRAAGAPPAGGHVAALELLARHSRSPWRWLPEETDHHWLLCQCTYGLAEHPLSLPILQWLVEHRSELKRDLNEENGVFAAAAGWGDLEVLAWLRRRGCPWGRQSFLAAVRAGNVAALEWMHAEGCPVEVRGPPPRGVQSAACACD
ncbi:hypothetical protein GPECTOR_42g836 [Gonium pectorale]|uniref:Uncharacterized protein n=1 Tax=Gonium pectorale TaxID=33097 RepID=A0A150GAN0_GONPE|nr:hypothetical protein GPECTOR_42g836 [Gonium pectorale]|eukprot:KXZ46625.1 hypothetical protein GPECTOR_42g836 [Gonium pectorale]